MGWSQMHASKKVQLKLYQHRLLSGWGVAGEGAASLFVVQFRFVIGWVSVLTKIAKMSFPREHFHSGVEIGGRLSCWESRPQWLTYRSVMPFNLSLTGQLTSSQGPIPPSQVLSFLVTPEISR